MATGPWYSTIEREKQIIASISAIQNTGETYPISATGTCAPGYVKVQGSCLGRDCKPYWFCVRKNVLEAEQIRHGYSPSVTEIPSQEHEGGTPLISQLTLHPSSSDGLSKFLQKLIGDLDKFKQPTVVVAPSQPAPAQPAGITWDWSAIVKGALIGIAAVMILRMLR